MEFFDNTMNLIWWAFKAAGVIITIIAVIYFMVSAHNHDSQGRSVAIFGIMAGVVLFVIGSAASGWMPAVPTF